MGPNPPGSTASNASGGRRNVTPAAQTTKEPLTRDELASLPSPVTNINEARAYLAGTGHLIDTEGPLNIDKFVIAMLQAAQDKDRRLAGNLRAFAFILETYREGTGRAVDKVEGRMEEMGAKLKAMEEQIAALGEQTNKVQRITEKLGAIEEDTLEMVGERVNEVRDAAQSAFEILQHAIERGSAQTTGKTGNIEDYDYGVTDDYNLPATRTAVTPAPKTYANTTKQTPQAPYQQIVEQNAKKNRRIIIDAKGPDVQSLTEEQLVAKANLAVDMISGEEEGRPQEVRFTSVKRLRNGGMEFELNMTQAASWIKSGAIKQKIISNFGNEAEIKEQGFAVLIENAPLYFRPEEEEDRIAVARVNG
ncbi:hypothetical protein PUNSTDRAFT_138865 [Punctularia strigosozonata HHB-11173 SS5]|uniref:Uncharacterized protein n=1 Tax=Punctularia strigosozonata (strain HHB-11173) TaxID=741275 RepID=R7S2W5_PUNST|nr:uncharacterized protein PUNSTDRAFT_138865 [Punctularia strigosozonata HHB-11173 SS5]EIN04137.1 hypothetical protein PUNSTDRAFT_138865 [Punctularia strigosozonata HHB-11173 SS5]